MFDVLRFPDLILKTSNLRQAFTIEYSRYHTWNKIFAYLILAEFFIMLFSRDYFISYIDAVDLVIDLDSFSNTYSYFS